MANYTENYNLKKPERTDFYSVQDFNDNADIIDAALDDKLNKDFSNVSSGAVPITNGGTGATTAANALSNLGALPLVGGTLTGDLRLKPANSNYGSKINFGDGDYAYIKENTDDNLEIKAKNINFAVTSGYDKLTVSTNADPTSSQKKALFTSAGNINTDLVKNYGPIGDNGVVRNQNVLAFIGSLEGLQCGAFMAENCTNTPNDNLNWWFMTLLINSGQKTLLANICSDTSNLTCKTWINQRWTINGVDTWCGWREVLTAPQNANVGVTYVVSSTPSTAQNNDLWAW